MDDCLGELTLWGLGVLGVLLAVQYVVIPYWYIFAAAGGLAGGVFIGILLFRRYAAKQRTAVERQIREFPALYAADMADLMNVLNNSGSYSAAFDSMVENYGQHRKNLSRESSRINRMARKYHIAGRVEDPNRI